MKSLLLYTFLVIFLSFGCRRSEFEVVKSETISDLGSGTGTTTWTKDKSYLINGFVFVNDGQVLTIEAGTIVRAKTGQGSLSSALIVARGGKIIAEGNSSNPIIFTAESDNLEGNIPLESKGLWGGLIILGDAPINTDSGEDMIEGIPISEPRGVYGGHNEDSNSGILRYVSIRHGGTNIGEGNEINGLTLGGVGRQTTIDHIEVISNADDGYEFFGGTVNCKNLVAAYCGDDAFDLDQGYNGKGQFFLGINNSDSDKGIECSGGLQALQILPDAFPTLHNVTLFGCSENDGLPLIEFYSYGAGQIYNSLFINTGAGIAISHLDMDGDSYSLFQNNSLSINNNEYYNQDTSKKLDIYCFDFKGSSFLNEGLILSDSLEAWSNIKANPLELSSSQEINLLPSSSVFDNMADYHNAWYDKVSYKGAFGSRNWIEGWTLLYESLKAP